MLTMTPGINKANAKVQDSYKKMLTEQRAENTTKYITDLTEGDRFKFKIDQKVFNGNVLRFLDTENLEDEYPVHQLRWTRRAFNANNTAEKSNQENCFAFVNGEFTVKNVDNKTITLQTPSIYFPKIDESGEESEVSTIDSVGSGLMVLTIPKDKIAVEIIKRGVKADAGVSEFEEPGLEDGEDAMDQDLGMEPADVDADVPAKDEKKDKKATVAESKRRRLR